MKKTWQWVVEYHTPLEKLGDSEHRQRAVDELLSWNKPTPPPDHIEFFRSYIEWVRLSEGIFQTFMFPHTQAISLHGKMRPKHLNECLQVMKTMFEKDRTVPPHTMRNASRIDEIRYVHRDDNFRLHNVKTGEVIPMEIFA